VRPTSGAAAPPVPPTPHRSWSSVWTVGGCRAARSAGRTAAAGVRRGPDSRQLPARRRPRPRPPGPVDELPGHDERQPRLRGAGASGGPAAGHPPGPAGGGAGRRRRLDRYPLLRALPPPQADHRLVPTRGLGTEHLHEAARAAHPEHAGDAEALASRLRTALWEGHASATPDALEELARRAGPRCPEDPAGHPRSRGFGTGAGRGLLPPSRRAHELPRLPRPGLAHRQGSRRRG
jgi:hypothetical protein